MAALAWMQHVLPLPVGLVQLILPFKLSALDHAVVPQDHAAGHALVHLLCQVLEEQWGVLHRSFLKAKVMWSQVRKLIGTPPSSPSNSKFICSTKKSWSQTERGPPLWNLLLSQLLPDKTHCLFDILRLWYSVNYFYSGFKLATAFPTLWHKHSQDQAFFLLR